jgi:hypothetical protein
MDFPLSATSPPAGNTLTYHWGGKQTRKVCCRKRKVEPLIYPDPILSSFPINFRMFTITLCHTKMKGTPNYIIFKFKQLFMIKVTIGWFYLAIKIKISSAIAHTSYLKVGCLMACTAHLVFLKYLHRI